jgi:hypothetical protein
MQCINVWIKTVALDSLHDVDDLREETFHSALRFVYQPDIPSTVLLIDAPGKHALTDRIPIILKFLCFHDNLLASTLLPSIHWSRRD